MPDADLAQRTSLWCIGSQCQSHEALRRNEGGLQPLNDFFVLDTKQMKWLYPKLAGGAGPAPRNAATLTAVGDKLVMYGGWDPFVQSYNDTYVMDVSGFDAIREEAPLDPDEQW